MSELLRGIQPIERKFLQPNYLFALQFREGFMFGRVIRRRICQWKPWELIDTNGNDIDIPAATTQPEMRFRDPRNVQNDILYLEQAVSGGLCWFFHGAFGIKPQQVQMYLRQPEGDIIPGKFPNIDPIRPAAGDRISNLNGLVSPYDTPTDYAEMVIVPRVHIGCEYYNLDAIRAHQPCVNILFSLYWMEVLKPSFASDLINAIASRRVPASYLTVGVGDLANDMGTLGDLEHWDKGDWGFVPLTLEEARRVSASSPIPERIRRRL